uniref:Chitin-binding type-2 domain-containing protein n=1 Tax=Heliothis virescens TaxID=7102 RepID=A0A2A4JGS2_HELVI
MKCVFESRAHSNTTISSEPRMVRHSATNTFNMFKLLVLSCLVATCLAGPFHLPSWIHWRPPRGCADRAAGWVACAHVNGTAALAPHPHDCRLFYYCSSVLRPICRRCPLGLHFNPELQVCDWPNNVNCTATPPPRPTRPAHNATTPVPTDAPTTALPLTDAPSTVPSSSDAPSSIATSSNPPPTDAISTTPPNTEAPSTTTWSSDTPSTDAVSTIAPIDSSSH